MGLGTTGEMSSAVIDPGKHEMRRMEEILVGIVEKVLNSKLDDLRADMASKVDVRHTKVDNLVSLMDSDRLANSKGAEETDRRRLEVKALHEQHGIVNVQNDVSHDANAAVRFINPSNLADNYPHDVPFQLQTATLSRACHAGGSGSMKSAFCGGEEEQQLPVLHSSELDGVSCADVGRNIVGLNKADTTMKIGVRGRAVNAVTGLPETRIGENVQRGLSSEQHRGDEFPTLQSAQGKQPVLIRTTPSPSEVLNKEAFRRPTKSFLDAVECANGKIEPKQLGWHKGEPALILSKEEIRTLSKPLALTLVGKFQTGCPSLDAIRRFFIRLGLKASAQVSPFDSHHVIVQMHSEADFSRVWSHQFYLINGKRMRVFKWTPEFRPTEESSIVPVWVRFPLLPLYVVVNHSYLFSIASAAGRPLRMDEATAAGRRFSMARILVEVDLRHKLQERVWVGDEEEGFWQVIEYENLPSFCVACRHLGHSALYCLGRDPGNQTTVVSADCSVLGSSMHTTMAERAPVQILQLQKSEPVTVQKEGTPKATTKQEWVEVKSKRRNPSVLQVFEPLCQITNGASTSAGPAKDVANVNAPVNVNAQGENDDSEASANSAGKIVVLAEGPKALMVVDNARDTEVHNVGTNAGVAEGSTVPAEVEKTGETVVTNTSGEEQPFEKVLRLSRTDYNVASDCSENSEWDEDRLHSYGGGSGFLSDDDFGMGRSRGFKMKGKKKNFRYRP